MERRTEINMRKENKISICNIDQSYLEESYNPQID